MVRRNTETNVFHVLSWGARLKAASSLAAKTIVLCLRYSRRVVLGCEVESCIQFAC